MAMAINASIQSAMQERPPLPDAGPTFEGSSSSGQTHTGKNDSLGPTKPNINISEFVHEAGPSGSSSQHAQIHEDIPAQTATGLDSIPSAPPVDGIPEDGPIQYPSIDLSPVDISSPAVGKLPKEEKDVASGSCAICLDAPAEGACIPCGHVAGCLSCLNEVKAKKWGCPVCRTKIDQVIKIYHV
ncbi:hypothetical protein L6164_012876 [Bauhinia variegata]|nr:hypothetical protein L6164_012876 [Bauhinia variegata]